MNLTELRSRLAELDPETADKIDLKNRRRVVRALEICLLTGKPASGFPLLEQAVAIKRSPENLISLAQALAYPGGGKDGTREQKVRAYSLVKEANRSPQKPTDPDYLFEHLYARRAIQRLA